MSGACRVDVGWGWMWSFCQASFKFLSSFCQASVSNPWNTIRNILFKTLICSLIYANKPSNNILLLKSVRFRIRHTLFFALLNNRFIRTVICYYCLYLKHLFIQTVIYHYIKNFIIYDSNKYFVYLLCHPKIVPVTLPSNVTLLTSAPCILNTSLTTILNTNYFRTHIAGTVLLQTF